MRTVIWCLRIAAAPIKTRLFILLLSVGIVSACDGSRELTVKGTVWGFDDAAVFLRATVLAQPDASYRAGFKVVGALPGADDIDQRRVAVRCEFTAPTLDYLRGLGVGRDVVITAKVPRKPTGTWQPGLRYSVFQAQHCRLVKVQSGGLMLGGWIDPPISGG
jgi:hypothetical protein